jgi:hypothetical protein
MSEKRNTYALFVGKAGGKKPLGRLRHKWVDETKVAVTDMG